MKRRTLIKSLATAGAMSPLVSLLGRSAIAAESTKPIRTLFIYHPNGCVPDVWHPAAGSLDLPVMTAPLESVKQHCVFLDGIGLVGDGTTHEGGAAKVLTANHMGDGNLSRSSSIDVLMGESNVANGLTLTKPSIQMGLFASKWSDKSISFKDTTRLPYSDNPLSLYADLFGDTGSSVAGEVDPAALANIQILSKARADLNRLRTQLGSVEQQRLEAHSDALTVLEAKLDALASGSGGSCGVLDLSGIGENDWQNDSPTGPMAMVSDAQQDIATMALSCDLTRVISFMYSHPVSPITNPEGGLGDHDASHADAATHTQSKVWWMKQIAKFINKLATTPDGGSDTLLDNTLILMVSELGHGNTHDHWRMPFVLAGGKNTGLTTGRSLDFRGVGTTPFGYGSETGATHADLLAQIALKAGYTDIDLPLATAPLAGIWS